MSTQDEKVGKTAKIPNRVESKFLAKIYLNNFITFPFNNCNGVSLDRNLKFGRGY
jgi:NADPH-dependent 7-cyano-7-deazaguanine reductase QueF-like protein